MQSNNDPHNDEATSSSQKHAASTVTAGDAPDELMLQIPRANCVAYICVGTLKWALFSHVRMCRAMADKAGLRITETYVDDYIGSRHQLQRLIVDAKLGKFTQVIISDIHRLASPELQLFDVTNALLSHGIIVHCGNRENLISMQASDAADAGSKAWQIAYLVNVICRRDSA
jgi:hypothetical protein